MNIDAVAGERGGKNTVLISRYLKMDSLENMEGGRVHYNELLYFDMNSGRIY